MIIKEVQNFKRKTESEIYRMFSAFEAEKDLKIESVKIQIVRDIPNTGNIASVELEINLCYCQRQKYYCLRL